MSDLLRVLIVDNAALMCNFVDSVMSQSKSVTVMKANNYKLACDILENDSVDILLTELTLDDDDTLGLELIKRVRSGEFSLANYDIPILVCSVDTRREMVKECIRYDVNDYLVKPISAEMIQRKISQQLKHPRKIRPKAHYASRHQAQLNSENAQKHADKGSKAYIILPVNEVERKHSVAPDNDELYPVEEYICWPENTSTGYLALDKHLKRLAFHVNGLHFAYTHNRRLIVLEKEQQNVCQAIDFLKQVAQSNFSANYRDGFFLRFMQRLEKLGALGEELVQINVNSSRKLADILKQLSYWWMATCSRSFISRTEQTNDSEPITPQELAS